MNCLDLLCAMHSIIHLETSVFSPSLRNELRHFMPVKQSANANKNTLNLFHPLNKIKQLQQKTTLKTTEGLFSLDHANKHREED